MTKLRELKALILCIFMVAVISLIAMFYYAVNFTRYTKLNLGMLHHSMQWNRHQGKSGSKGPRWKKGLMHQALERLATSRDQRENIHHERANITKAKLASGNQSDYRRGLCPIASSTLVGRLHVDKSIPKMEDIEKTMSSEFSGWVDTGGHWKPTKCKARVKMALIIPYRNRYEQLSIFLRHMHPMLKKQNLHYRIFVIEQVENTTFNRGMLLNIGFKEALKYGHYKCFIFHDVDLIPENDRNKYSCPSSPRHLSVAVDKFDYRLPYQEIFRGVESFTREHFELINGFSNKFWGWGGEDDDLYNRISAKGLNLTRPSLRLGRYKMLKKFHKSSKPNLHRFENLEDSVQRMDNDGLNTLKYTVKKLIEHRLYTLITVDVKEAMLQDRTALTLEEGTSSFYFQDNTTKTRIDKSRENDDLFTIN